VPFYNSQCWPYHDVMTVVIAVIEVTRRKRHYRGPWRAWIRRSGLAEECYISSCTLPLYMTTGSCIARLTELYLCVSIMHQHKMKAWRPRPCMDMCRFLFPSVSLFLNPMQMKMCRPLRKYEHDRTRIIHPMLGIEPRSSECFSGLEVAP
jgi:hypothetical protein